MQDNSENKMSLKEKRIREITFIYYSRSDVRKAIFKFAKNRECIPRYYEGFGKRPDTFQYDQDILEQVRRGATSFHCSEELWQDSLEISNELSEQEFNDLRIGWDLLLDIDSPYLEYSKILAQLLIKVLKQLYGIENVGVKFSGSKGFHVIIPWNAFPKEIYNQKTKDMFPEWPRAICGYLKSVLEKKLEQEILEDDSVKELVKKTGKQEQELIVKECIRCHRPAVKKNLITWICPYCKNEIVNLEGSFNNRKKPICPECRKDLTEKLRKEIYFCEFCQINSEKSPEMFKEEKLETGKLIEADLILVAPRHLFRMPYSLHEKTALSSIVIDKDKIKDFQMTDAKPFKIDVKEFYPIAKPEEARELLIEALEWKGQKDREEEQVKALPTPFFKKSTTKKNKNFQNVKIPNPKEDIFPPCIKLILKGVEQDGRKRALFILINFFKSLGLDEQELENRISQWNEKNYKPLKQGYIRSQLQWHNRQSARLPPNCDKPHYKDLGVCKPDSLCREIKNPINYAVKMYFRGMK